MSRRFIVAIGGMQAGAFVSKLCSKDWSGALIWGAYFVANLGLLMAR